MGDYWCLLEVFYNEKAYAKYPKCYKYITCYFCYNLPLSKYVHDDFPMNCMVFFITSFVYFGPQSGEIPKMTSLWCHDVIWCMTSFWGIPPIFGIQNKNKNVVKNATGFILKSSWILTNYIWLERGRLNLQQYAICEDPWGLYESQKLSKSAQILDFLKMPYRSHLCRCPADTSNQT